MIHKTPLKTTPENNEGAVGEVSTARKSYGGNDGGRVAIMDLFTFCCAVVISFSPLQTKLALYNYYEWLMF